jgi:hypothetical protein
MRLAAQTAPAKAPPAVVGSIAGARGLTIDNIALSPTGSASWPVVEGDEVTTEDSALFNTADRNVAVFDPNSRMKLRLVDSKQTYIFLRQGGVAFEARTGRIYICAANRLFVPETNAKGVVRIGVDKAVFEHLDRGVFAEDGTRACDENAPASPQTKLPGAAGAVIPAAAPHAGVGAGTIAAVAAGTAAIGVGSALLLGGATTVSTPCTGTGCNTNPPALSTVTP